MLSNTYHTEADAKPKRKYKYRDQREYLKQYRLDHPVPVLYKRGEYKKKTRPEDLIETETE